MKVQQALDLHRAPYASVAEKRAFEAFLKQAGVKDAGVVEFAKKMWEGFKRTFRPTPARQARRTLAAFGTAQSGELSKLLAAGPEQAVKALKPGVALTQERTFARVLKPGVTQEQLAKMTPKQVEEAHEMVLKGMKTVAKPAESEVAESLRLLKQLSEGAKGPAIPWGYFALAGAGLAAGVGLPEIAKRYQHKQNLQSIIRDPEIPARDRGKAVKVYGVLKRYAPSIAEDETFSKDFVKNLVRHEAIDHKVISDLISAEKMYRDAHGNKAELIKGLGGLLMFQGIA